MRFLSPRVRNTFGGTVFGDLGAVSRGLAAASAPAAAAASASASASAAHGTRRQCGLSACR